jgi:hypothetical protein
MWCPANAVTPVPSPTSMRRCECALSSQHEHRLRLFLGKMGQGVLFPSRLSWSLVGTKGFASLGATTHQ